MAEKDRTWNKNINLHDFPKDTLLEIKKLSDKHNGSREWLANVYYDNEKYQLGAPIFGSYSGVTMKPDEQAVKDKKHTGIRECVDKGYEKDACNRIVGEQMQQTGRSLFGAGNTGAFGADPEDLVATIHLHPIHSFESEHDKDIRSQFSGTDIGSEFAKAVRDGKEYRLFLVIPEKVGGRRHTILKLIKFPGKTSMQVMKASNPHLSDEQIWDITPEGKGIDTVDWYAYQDESKKRGLLQELDIEKATGAEAYASYGNYYIGFVVVGIAATIAIAMYLNWRKKKK